MASKHEGRTSVLERLSSDGSVARDRRHLLLSEGNQHEGVVNASTTSDALRVVPATTAARWEPSSRSFVETITRRPAAGYSNSSVSRQHILSRGPTREPSPRHLVERPRRLVVKATRNVSAEAARASSPVSTLGLEAAIDFTPNVTITGSIASDADDTMADMAAKEEARQGRRDVATARKPEARPHLKAVPGTCLVCLADCEHVLGAQWVHQDPFPEAGGARMKTDCPVSACVSCLKTYFEGTIARGYDGVCPRMRCISCPRVVCERAWVPLVDPSAVESFRRRARILLSMMCSGCHALRDFMAIPPDQGHSYSSAVDRLLRNVGTSFDSELDGRGAEQEALPGRPERLFCKPDVEAFCMALRRYASGDDIDPAEFYDVVEAIIFKGLGSGDKDDRTRSKRMMELLHCIEDSERRASLHLRYLRIHTKVSTGCCGKQHCFRCKISGDHPGLTCDKFEAVRGVQDILQCPACGVYIVKSDGCDAITCVCSNTFCWTALVRQRALREVEVFRELHPEDTPRTAVQILRGGAPSSLAYATSVTRERNFDDKANSVQRVQQPSDAKSTAIRNKKMARMIPGGPIKAVVANRIEPTGRAEVLDAEEDAIIPQQTVGKEAAEVYFAPAVPDRPPEAHRVSKEEFRLASAFVRRFPKAASAAHAAIFGEEHVHFTAQRAMWQATSNSPNEWGYLGHTLLSRPTLPATPGSSNEVEREWQTIAARDWLRENREVLCHLRRQVTAARSALVEALYGDNDDPIRSIPHPTIVAAVTSRAREALHYARSNAALDQGRMLLTGRAGEGNTGPVARGRWGPAAIAHRLRRRPEEEDPIPELAATWTARPIGRHRCTGLATKIGPGGGSKREASHFLWFGSRCLEADVEAWLEASPSRRRQVEHVVAGQEERLSNAWVALWGQQNLKLQSLSPTASRDEQGDLVEAAARRCAFLEAHPEHACREQAAMMNAFLRRNRGAVERARGDAFVQQASGERYPRAPDPSTTENRSDVLGEDSTAFKKAQYKSSASGCACASHSAHARCPSDVFAATNSLPTK